MTSAAVTAGTSAPLANTEDYKKGDDTYQPNDRQETQQPPAGDLPQPYARIVVLPGLDGMERVSIWYDHARAEREMGFLRLNEILESRRR